MANKNPESDKIRKTFLLEKITLVRGEFLSEELGINLTSVVNQAINEKYLSHCKQYNSYMPDNTEYINTHTSKKSSNETAEETLLSESTNTDYIETNQENHTSSSTLNFSDEQMNALNDVIGDLT